MKRFALFLALAISSTSVFAQQSPLPPTEDKEVIQIHQQMLLPSVQIRAGKGTGSGTVVASRLFGKEYHTYVLTNFHVVADAVTKVEEYDQEKKEDRKRERRELVEVQFHRYMMGSRLTGSDNRTAEIVAYDKSADLALLRLEDTSVPVAFVARVMPSDARLERGEHVFAVGAGLGVPPFMTEGRVGSTGHRIDGYPYILASAPIIFGNSGGGLYRYHKDHYELVGVPSRVASTGSFFSASAVTHIGWHIEMATVRKFLENNRLAHVIDSAN